MNESDQLSKKSPAVISSDLTSITVGGKTLKLTYPAWEAIGSAWSDTRNAGDLDILCCQKYSDVRVGIVELDATYLFYAGNETAVSDLPSGKVTYDIEGYYNGSTNNQYSNGYFGSSVLTASFADKTLKGTLIDNQDHHLKPLEVNATINGNKFSGTVTNTEHQIKSAKLEGGFFGSEAKQIGGAFATEGKGEGWYGVFAGETVK